MICYHGMLCDLDLSLQHFFAFMVSVPSLEHYDFLFPCNGINYIEMLTICQILAQETEKNPRFLLRYFQKLLLF